MTAATRRSALLVIICSLLIVSGLALYFTRFLVARGPFGYYCCIVHSGYEIIGGSLLVSIGMVIAGLAFIEPVPNPARKNSFTKITSAILLSIGWLLCLLAYTGWVFDITMVVWSLFVADSAFAASLALLGVRLLRLANRAFPRASAAGLLGCNY